MVCSSYISVSWWRHQMETFAVLLAICAGNSPVSGEFPAQRPVTQSFDVFFDLRLNERLSKQSLGWWFETPSHPLWRQNNDTFSTNQNFDSQRCPISHLNTLRPRQNCRHFTDDIFKCIFLNENVWISLKISLPFVPKFRINNIPALVIIMAWCQPGDKP